MENKYRDLLSEHADRLNSEVDVAAQLLTENSRQSIELATLFDLAQSIKSVLVPVRAPAFKASLRHRLEISSRRPNVIDRISSRQNIVWVVVAATGSVVSITGVVLLVLRKIRTSGTAKQHSVSATA